MLSAADYAVVRGMAKRWRENRNDDFMKKCLACLPRRVRVLLVAQWLRSAMPLWASNNHRAEDVTDIIGEIEIRAVSNMTNRIPSVRWITRQTGYTRDCEGLASATGWLITGGTYWTARACVRIARAAGCHRESDAFRRMVQSMSYAPDSATRRRDAELFQYAGADLRQETIKWMNDTFLRSIGPNIEFQPEWRTSTVVALALHIVATRDRGLMPIFADALQDAGCDHPELMTHLQGEPTEHTLADWSIWQTLDLDSINTNTKGG